MEKQHDILRYFSANGQSANSLSRSLPRGTHWPERDWAVSEWIILSERGAEEQIHFIISGQTSTLKMSLLTSRFFQGPVFFIFFTWCGSAIRLSFCMTVTSSLFFAYGTRVNFSPQKFQQLLSNMQASWSCKELLQIRRICRSAEQQREGKRSSYQPVEKMVTLPLEPRKMSPHPPDVGKVNSKSAMSVDGTVPED